MEKPISFNFRKLIRGHLPLNVEYEILGEEQVKGRTLSKNFSSSGINILIPQRLRETTFVHLKIHLPSVPGPISATGKTIYQKEIDYLEWGKKRYFMTGIEFTEISSLDKNKLMDCVISNLRKESEEADTKLINMIENLNLEST